MSKKTTAKKATTEAAAGTVPTASTPNSSLLTPTCQSAIALALCVMVTLPPKEKFDAGKGYWQIEIKDQQGQRYSDVYRTKNLEMAHTLAEKIAKDRKLPIVTQEPPAPRAKANEPAQVAEPVPMPDPEDYDADGTPF